MARKTNRYEVTIGYEAYESVAARVAHYEWKDIYEAVDTRGATLYAGIDFAESVSVPASQIVGFSVRKVS